MQKEITESKGRSRQPRDSPALRHMAVIEIILSSGPPHSQYTGGIQASQLRAASEKSHWTL